MAGRGDTSRASMLMLLAGLVLAWPSPSVGVPPDKCTPFKVPAPYKNIAEYCGALQSDPLSIARWTEEFLKAPPARSGQFPLKGCIWVCSVGTNVRSTIAKQIGFTGWCFRHFDNAGDPINATDTWVVGLQRKPFGVLDLVRSGKATEEEGFTVPVEIKPSSLDAKPAWILDLVTAYNTFRGVSSDAFRDELRVMGPGIMAKNAILFPKNLAIDLLTNTTTDDTPLLRIRASPYVAMQTCAENGDYAWSPMSRMRPDV